MSTIEQARADRARVNIQQQNDHQVQVKGEQKPGTAKAGSGKGLVIADGVDGKGAASNVSNAAPATTTATAGANPFVAVNVTGADAQAILLAAPLGIDVPVEGQSDHMGKLDGLSASLILAGKGDAAAKTDSVRTGFMLLGSDAGDQAEGALGEDVHASARALGSMIATQASAEDKTEAVKRNFVQAAVQQQATVFPANMDINAYVQSVLRESYMVQQGQLKDFADELKKANAKRREIQEEMRAKRELKTKIDDGSVTAADFAAAGIELTDDEETALSAPWGGSADLAAAQEELADLQNVEVSADPGPTHTDDAPVDYTSHFAEPSAPSNTTSNSEQSLDAFWQMWLGNFASQQDDGMSNLEDVFVHMFTQDGNFDELGKEPLSQADLINAFHTFASTSLSDQQVNDIADALTWSMSQGEWKDQAAGLREEFLKSLSPQQAAKLKDHVAAGLQKKADDPKYQLGVKLGLNAGTTDKNYVTAYVTNLQSQTSIPLGGSAEMVAAREAFIIAKANNFAPPFMDRALQVSHALKGAEATSFLKCVAADAPNDAFDKFVKTSNPTEVFAGANVNDTSSLDFLNKSATGQAALADWVKQKKPADAATTPPAKMTQADKDEAIKAATKKVSDLETAQTSYNASTNHLTDTMKTELGDKVQSVVDSLKEEFDAQGQDVQQMQLDLQDAMQKSQELMTMMTNMSKMVHETMMSIIRNMGG